MQRMQALVPEETTTKSKEMFDAIQKKLGMVPNMMRTMGNSPAVLNGYLSFSGALGEASIGAKLGEQIALAVANANSCEYCNAAHSYIGEKLVGIDLDTIQISKSGKSSDKKTEAALVFARKLVEKRGMISDVDVSNVKQAGFTDQGIAEIIAHTALNIFTNYFNNGLKVVVDFPKVDLVKEAAV